MKILPLQGSTIKTLLFQKISTACGGLPNGGFTSLCLVRASLRSPDAAKLGLT
jgi:hypothetical protein